MRREKVIRSDAQRQVPNYIIVNIWEQPLVKTFNHRYIRYWILRMTFQHVTNFHVGQVKGGQRSHLSFREANLEICGFSWGGTLDPRTHMADFRFWKLSWVLSGLLLQDVSALPHDGSHGTFPVYLPIHEWLICLVKVGKSIPVPWILWV